MEIAKPNFLIIGAEKSGTTWLYNKLKKHPEIYLPLTKECHFFNKYHSNLNGPDNYIEMGWEWYNRFFEDTPETAKAIGEVTPMYLCDPKAPERIAGDLPGIKLIYILRNPVLRAYSHYWMAFRKKHTSKTFDEIVANKDPRFIKRSEYAKQLQKYYNLFPHENIKGFIYESFFEAPYEGLNHIYDFLGLKKKKIDECKSNKKLNSSVKPKSVFMNNLISKTAKALRKNLVTFGLLDWLKSNGIAPAIKQWNLSSEEYPPMSDSVYNQLFDYYRSDIEELRSQYHLNVDCWSMHAISY